MPFEIIFATLVFSLSSSSSSLAQDSAAEEKPGPEDKAEIVPKADVMDLIETDILAEDGNDECNWRNKTMP
jgi:hypothetical protein